MWDTQTQSYVIKMKVVKVLYLRVGGQRGSIMDPDPARAFPRRIFVKNVNVYSVQIVVFIRSVIRSTVSTDETYTSKIPPTGFMGLLWLL